MSQALSGKRCFNVDLPRSSPFEQSLRNPSSYYRPFEHNLHINDIHHNSFVLLRYVAKQNFFTHSQSFLTVSTTSGITQRHILASAPIRMKYFIMFTTANVIFSKIIIRSLSLLHHQLQSLRQFQVRSLPPVIFALHITLPSTIYIHFERRLPIAQ